jgi:DNA-directed RNA polymerase specialized sigma24 family protein
VAESTPIVRMLRGDEAELFRQHEVALKRAVRAAVRAPEACIEDACSFAWLQLLRRQPDRATVFGWLRTVAIHEAWLLAARERRDRHLEEMPAWNERSGAEDPPVVEAHTALRILAELPERQRRYLALLAAGFSYNEIADRCDATYTNVNKHLVRARRHLRLVHDATD